MYEFPDQAAADAAKAFILDKDFATRLSEMTSRRFCQQAQLPEQSAPELDDPVQGVFQRARDDWPCYGEVLSFAALKN